MVSAVKTAPLPLLINSNVAENTIINERSTIKILGAEELTSGNKA